MIRYQVLQQKKNWHDGFFATMHVVMWSKTQDDLCIKQEERDLRRFLTWLNSTGKNYYIEVIDEEAERRDKIRAYEDAVGLPRGGRVVYGGSSRDDPEYLKYVVHVEEETAIMIKLFYPQYKEYVDPPEPVPPKPSEPEPVSEEAKIVPFPTPEASPEPKPKSWLARNFGWRNRFVNQ